MKIEMRIFHHEWAFSISLTPGIFWIDFFYFELQLMTAKFIKENNFK